jgi:hypothetical protein
MDLLMQNFALTQVENSLFKIPRFLLVKQSLIFTSELPSCQYECTEVLTRGPDWSGDEINPFVVHGITADEFRHFLQIIMPGFTTDL